MFSGLRSRLMVSFTALLLVCLCIAVLTFTYVFFLWVSLPELAFAHLSETAVPVLSALRSTAQTGGPLREGLDRLVQIAQERDVRLLLLSADGTILTDAEGEWAGEQVQLATPPETAASRLTIRGRTRGPDGVLRFYVAIPLQDSRLAGSRRVYLALTVTRWETFRPLVRSIAASVGLSGTVAFVLSSFLALWMARTLAQPLQRAAAAAERVAGGDYTSELEIGAPDEARRLADSFNAMTRAVAASQRAQQDFVANVSHELRTPLTSIRGFAQAIADGTASDAASVQRAAAVIEDEADRLARLVGDLLELARLESGETHLARAPLDLVALARACLERFAPLADREGILLSLQESGPVQVDGDGDRLMQVLTNLIDNALQHTDRGGQVTISTEISGRLASVSVSDTGHGIPKTDLPRLFERFYQVDKSRSRDTARDQQGVGLGLAISAEIVRAHGGHIDVESIVGLGSRFTVVLPVLVDAGGAE
jgi:signal transduction histidine kinase